MAEYVIDSSAMLALVGNEPGAEHVRERIARSLASAVNLAEVGAVLSDRGLSDAEVWEVMVKLGSSVRRSTSIRRGSRPSCAALLVPVDCRWETGPASRSQRPPGCPC